MGTGETVENINWEQEQLALGLNVLMKMCSHVCNNIYTSDRQYTRHRHNYIVIGTDTGACTFIRVLFQDFCADEWRLSRLEIDCAKGDGLNFIAPKGSRCNPFSSESEGTSFYY